MPGYDRTGPAGQGPMTGRGLGPCGAGMAYGRQGNYSRGGGRGFNAGGRQRFRFWQQSAMAPQDDRMDQLQEQIEELKNEIRALRTASENSNNQR